MIVSESQFMMLNKHLCFTEEFVQCSQLMCHCIPQMCKELLCDFGDQLKDGPNESRGMTVNHKRSVVFLFPKRDTCHNRTRSRSHTVGITVSCCSRVRSAYLHVTLSIVTYCRLNRIQVRETMTQNFMRKSCAASHVCTA